MSETTVTQTCADCGMESTDLRIFIVTHPLMPVRCYSEGACSRRQKRNKVLAEMEEMAKKPYVHPVDKFSRTSIALCGFFLGCIAFIGSAYLWFGV